MECEAGLSSSMARSLKEELGLLRTGIMTIDEEIGGLPRATLYLLSGEEKSGRTTLALQIACIASNSGLSVYWVDCGDRLNLIRLRRVAERWNADLSRIFVSVPRSLKQQEEKAVWLGDHADAESLIVFDDYTYLHRTEMSGNVRLDKPLFHSLTFQTALLKDAVVSKRATVIIITEVHYVPGEERQRPVAEYITGFFSDVKILMKNLSYDVKLLTITTREKGSTYNVKVTDYGIVG